MEDRVSPILCNTFNAIYLRQSFAVCSHLLSGTTNLPNGEEGLIR